MGRRRGHALQPGFAERGPQAAPRLRQRRLAPRSTAVSQCRMTRSPASGCLCHHRSAAVAAGTGNLSHEDVPGLLRARRREACGKMRLHEVALQSVAAGLAQERPIVDGHPRFDLAQVAERAIAPGQHCLVVRQPGDDLLWPPRFHLGPGRRRARNEVHAEGAQDAAELLARDSRTSPVAAEHNLALRLLHDTLQVLDQALVHPTRHVDDPVDVQHVRPLRPASWFGPAGR
mmetsp:Transcript_81185/g.225978  ORF Transcript_81185/g.225978 Transcript_81185/m.225978 type:complete len:231 (+) Transcript_81185:225-917(+)